MKKTVERIYPKNVWDSSSYQFSQAARTLGNNLLFISGQVGMDKEGKIVGHNFEIQAEQAFRNIGEILNEVGVDWENIVKLNVYLTDMNNLSSFSQIAVRYFKGNYPAQTVVEIKKLALPELLLEVEAIAILP